jgi:hypothetical protein
MAPNLVPKTESKKIDMQLPENVVGLVDIGRLQREVEAVEVFVAQAAARKSGEAVAMPKTTRNLEALCSHNGVNLLVNEDRRALGNFLVEVRNSAPRVHMSFASDPSAAFMKKIVTWFRTSAHPLTIIQVGLQPTLAAGCTLRTANKYFDMSLRKDFDSHKSALISKLRETRQSSSDTPSATEVSGAAQPGKEVQTHV